MALSHSRPVARTSSRQTLRATERRVPAWLSIVKPLLLAVFTAMFFLLAYSMSHHGFFTGGPYNEPARATQPYVP